MDEHMKKVDIVDKSTDGNRIVTTDIYLVAFLSYNKLPYAIGVSGNRVSFIFDNISDRIPEYYQSGIDNVNVLRYIEKLKQIKVEMYRKRDEKQP